MSLPEIDLSIDLIINFVLVSEIDTEIDSEINRWDTIERSISWRSISGSDIEIDLFDLYRGRSLRLIQRLVSKIGLWISEIDL